MSITIGLNHTDSTNRIRFEKLSQRLQKVNVDILHSTRHSSTLQQASKKPDTGDLGCFFQDELETCNKLETSRLYRKYVVVHVYNNIAILIELKMYLMSVLMCVMVI